MDLTKIENDLSQISQDLQDLRASYNASLTKLKNHATKYQHDFENITNERKKEFNQQLNDGITRFKDEVNSYDLSVTEARENIKAIQNLQLSEGNQVIIKVGNEEGQFNTLSAALNEALKYKPFINENASFTHGKVVVEIQEGWEFIEPVALYNIDLRHVVLTQANFDNPILCSFEPSHMVNFTTDISTAAKILLYNSHLTIDKLNLKAKAKDLTNNACCNSYICTTYNSHLSANYLKADDSLLTSTNGNLNYMYINGWQGFFECVNLDLTASQATARAVQISQGSATAIRNLTIKGSVKWQALVISDLSNAYIVNATITAPASNYTVCIDRASNLKIYNLTITAKAESALILAAGVSSFCSYGNLNFTQASVGNNGYMLSLLAGSRAVLSSNGLKRKQGMRDCNVNINTWSYHGTWCYV